jgi:alkanesulfonate monooxygenase SsuD/methylene tetrahydromethanopterin reductase-like flavin-dependent oxidoreductase (luciferase family)
VKLDLLYEVDVPKPWEGEHPYAQRREEQRAYREALDQIRHADTLGFNTVWCVEHHFRENRSHMPCSEAVLGALSQITKNLRLGFGVTLTPHPFIHPARLAEKVATVDILSEGRVEWGTGRSTPMEQTAFGVDKDLSRRQWRAAIDTVVQMWESEYYEEHSEFLDFPKRMVTPKPFQDPHPPCWMAAVSEDSAKVAGEAGLGVLAMSIMRPLEETRRLVERYREAQKNQKLLTRVPTNKVAAYTLVHCVEDRKELETKDVWRSVWWWYQNLAEFALQWELPHYSKEEQEKAYPLLAARARGEVDLETFDREDMIIIGTPDECLRKIQRYADVGVDHVICYKQFGYLKNEDIKRSMSLLGEHVIPKLNAKAKLPETA